MRSTRLLSKHCSLFSGIIVTPHAKTTATATLSQFLRLKSATAPSSATTTTTTTSNKGGFEDLDKPIKFTTSKAADWRAIDSLGGGAEDRTPGIQPLSVCASVGIFLLYFLYLREENDVDEEMKRPLWDRVPGLETKQLETVLEYNRQHNLPTKDIESRLAVLYAQDKARLK